MRTSFGAALVAATTMLAVACGNSGTASRSSEFCNQMRDLRAEFGDVGAGEATQDQAVEMVEAMKALDAPAEVTDDLGTVVDFLEYVVENGTEEGAPVSVEEWEDATSRFDNFAKDECNLAEIEG